MRKLVEHGWAIRGQEHPNKYTAAKHHSEIPVNPKETIRQPRKFKLPYRTRLEELLAEVSTNPSVAYGALEKETGLHRETIKRISWGHPPRIWSAYKLCKALTRLIGGDLRPEDLWPRLQPITRFEELMFDSGMVPRKATRMIAARCGISEIDVYSLRRGAVPQERHLNKLCVVLGEMVGRTLLPKEIWPELGRMTRLEIAFRDVPRQLPETISLISEISGISTASINCYLKGQIPRYDVAVKLQRALAAACGKRTPLEELWPELTESVNRSARTDQPKFKRIRTFRAVLRDVAYPVRDAISRLAEASGVSRISIKRCLRGEVPSYQEALQLCSALAEVYGISIRPDDFWPSLTGAPELD